MFLRSAASIHVLLFATLSALASFAGAPNAAAQSSDMRIKVPFAFEANQRHFEPGTYTIHMDHAWRLIQINGDSQSGQVMFLPDSTLNPAAAGKIVFHRYGSQYFLREVWIANSNSHVHTLPSKAEKQLQLAVSSVSRPSNTGEELAVAELPH